MNVIRSSEINRWFLLLPTLFLLALLIDWTRLVNYLISTSSKELLTRRSHVDMFCVSSCDSFFSFLCVFNKWRALQQNLLVKILLSRSHDRAINDLSLPDHKELLSASQSAILLFHLTYFICIKYHLLNFHHSTTPYLFTKWWLHSIIKESHLWSRFIIFTSHSYMIKMV